MNTTTQNAISGYTGSKSDLEGINCPVSYDRGRQDAVSEDMKYIWQLERELAEATGENARLKAENDRLKQENIQTVTLCTEKMKEIEKVATNQLQKMQKIINATVERCAELEYKTMLLQADQTNVVRMQ